MVKKLLIGVLVVLVLSVGSFFIPAREMSIEGIGQLSFETKVTLSVGSETAYAAPDTLTNSPSADSGGWTDPTNAYADGGGYASITSGTPSASHTYSGYGFNLTGNQINQVRVRYDAWCAGNTAAANQQRVPTADGGVSGTWNTAPRWDDVDETIPNDADYMTGVNTGPGGNGYCLFTFSAFSVPTGSTITDLTVYYRAMDAPGGGNPNNIRCSLRIGGAYYHTTAPSVNPGGSFTTYSYAYAVNPATSSAWTVANINSSLQQFGVYSTDLGPDIRVSMVYAQVNYTTTVYDEQIRIDVSWDGGISSWSSQQTTTLTGAEATYWYDVTDAPGFPWTPTMLNDTNFRVRVDAYTQGTASEVRLDWIPVAVDYTPPATCWLSGWAKRTRLSIDRNDITAPLTDFPVMLYLSTSSGRNNDDVSFVFDELQSNANRFKIAVTTNDCTTQCYVEIEKWDQTNEQAWLWVRVPSISNTTDTELQLYYDRNQADNTTYVGDTNSTPAEMVWDGNFKLVQHLGENSTVVHDSTANNNDETNPPPVPPSPGYTRATYTDSGRIDGGYSFSNGSRLQMANSSSLDITQSITLEAFVYLNDRSDGKFIAKDDPLPSASGCYCLQQQALSGTPTLQLQLDFGGTWYRVTYPTYNTGEWIYVVGTYNGSAMTLYTNGAQRATQGQTGTITSAIANLGLGNRSDDVGTDFDMNGLLDEVRISATTRSAEWIVASYESGRDDLVDFGPEEGANITNTPSSIDFGSVSETHDYWSNGSEPTFPLDDGECFFTLTNLSSGAVDISIKATNFSGGVGWTLTGGAPGENTVRMKAGRSGDIAEGDMVILNTGDQDFMLSLPAFTSRKWEIKLETGTFTDNIQKTSTITLTASIA